MTKRLTPEVEEQYLRDMTRLHEEGAHVHIEIRYTTAVILVAHLQLALRHPGNRGPCAKEMRKLVDDLIENMAHTPAIRAVLEAGDDPDYDDNPAIR